MINYLKDKYYWHKVDQKLRIFLKEENDQKILMFGYPKSGNTWLRFLLFNYCNLLLNPDEDKTISYDRLNILQNNVMDRGTTFSNEKGFPLFYRTHKIYHKSYSLFSPKIFIHRNPLDTLISAYYFYKNRDVPFSDDVIEIREKLFDIDFYICYNINNWINFYYTSLKNADVVMNYSKMRVNCKKELSELICFLDWDFDEKLVEKAVEFSSFKNVKKMGEVNSQQYGNGPNDGTFNGEFTRSGLESQFYDELQDETINFVLDKFPNFNKIYPNLIE